MKKLQLLAYAGTIALLSTGFTACSDDNLAKEEVILSPGYNPQTNEVTADFVFNVSTNTSTTRMTSANVQAAVAQSTGEAFRGITDARLYAIKLRKYKSGSTSETEVNDGQHLTDEAPAVTPVVKKFDLGTVMPQNSIAPAGDGTSLPQSRRVVELALPTETNTLVFYGHAIKDGTDQTQGKTDIILSESGNMNDVHFRLCKVLPDGSESQTAFQQCQALIVAVLTKIINTSYTPTTDVVVSERKINANTTVRWSDYVTITRGTGETASVITAITPKDNDAVTAVGETTKEMSNLGEILAQTYATFNTIYNQGTHSELRAGSGPAIKRMINDLYTVINTVAQATPVNLEETIAKRLAQQIVQNINACFDTSSGCEWRTNGLLITFAGLSEAQVTKVDQDATMIYFPKNRFNLPYGATVLEIGWNTTKSQVEYNYMGAVPTYAMGGGSTSSFDPANYTFAPELCYFGNSPIRVTNATKSVADYPDGTLNWTSSTNSLWSDWTDNGHVLSTTRSVAMRDCINYGNALLKTQVKFGTNILKDNNHQIQMERTGADEQDNKINVGTAGLFNCTGILIGGQNGSVGWNFIPRADAGISESGGPQFKYMVYDGDIVSPTIPAATSALGGSATDPTYTLLWDNYDPSMFCQDQRTVYVALEFVNNSGRDFWGMNNLIPNGGTFYITGKLDPDAITVDGKSVEQIKDDKSLGIDWPVSYEMPPYYTSDQISTATAYATGKSLSTTGIEVGKTIKQRRVFMQDYMTEATFVLTENSLKYALVAVPDLRSSQISMGLSVDLHWRQGLQFTANLEGGQ